MIDEFGFLFDGGGFDPLAFDDLAMVDPSAAFVDGFGLDMADLDSMGSFADVGFDFGFDTIGYGSDLEDLLIANPSDVIEIDLADPGGPIDLTSALDIDPGALPDLDPNSVMGGFGVPSPFASPEMGGAAVAASAPAWVPGVFNPPTDSFNVAEGAMRGGRMVTRFVTFVEGTPVAETLQDKIASFAKTIAVEGATDIAKGELIKGARITLDFAKQAVLRL
ncbi:MAG: hypothetical protein AAF467_21090 [Actinomycetota bacterium]